MDSAIHHFNNWGQDYTPIVKVKGNLKPNVAYWQHLGASRFIRDTIVDGYTIPFICTPPSAHFTNNRSDILCSDFVAQAISDLLATGSVVECDSAPIVVNPLSVSVQSNGKKKGLFCICGIRLPVLRSKIGFVPCWVCGKTSRKAAGLQCSLFVGRAIAGI